MNNPNSQNPIVLVDGSTYLFRGFYGAPDLRSSTGQYTGAIRAVVSMLLRLMKDFPHSPVIVVFDTAKPTFRHSMYAEYKANRPPMPQELQQQIPPLFEIIQCMGLPLLRQDGYEADDIIGTLATQATEMERKTIISTSDKDMAQLVNDHVTLLDTMKNVSTDQRGVEEKFGVPPDKIIDYLALMGDTSDNIPGVPKVGPKTAAKWLNTFGDLDQVIACRDQIKGKVGENLNASIGHLPLSRELATIKRDVPLEYSVDELAVTAMDVPAITDWFNKLEFRTLLRQITETGGESLTPSSSAAFEFITDRFTLQQWVGRIQAAQQMSVILIRTQRDVFEFDGVGIALSTESGEAAYIPISHDDEEFRQLSIEQVLSVIKPVFEDDRIAVIGNDLKSVINFFHVHGIQLKGELWDTRLMSYIIHSNAHGGHGVGSLAARHLQYTTKDLLKLTGSGVKRIPFAQVGIPEATIYAAELASVNLQVFPILQEQLQRDNALIWLYEQIERPLTHVLAKMERGGVGLDQMPIDQLGGELAQRIESLTQRAYEVVGEKFGMNSPKQLQEILFDRLGLSAPRKTRTGNRSTSEDVLRELVYEHELPQIILDYRAAAKLKSTYTDQLGRFVNPTDHRIHTTYDQANASTGRLASNNPNLQNIPIRTVDGRRLREAFVPAPGCVMFSADYSQIELRVMAHLAGDQSMIDAFNQGLDIHRATAQELFDLPYADISDSMRRNAKAINFGLIYGMSAFGLARNIGSSRTEARVFIDRYFYKYPGVPQYMEATKIKARENGYVETIRGRRTHIDEINSSDRVRRSAAERFAINAPVQGSAADIIKEATIKIDEWLTTHRLATTMVLHVHDEIVFEVPRDELDEIQQGVPKVMETVVDLSVELVVDTGIGANWSEAH